MNHKTEIFKFKDSKSKVVELKTVDYTFEVYEILVNRFGEEALEKFNKTGVLDKDIKLSDIEEDFPKLLKGKGIRSIVWKEQIYDTLLEVYVFFIKYKRNALLRNIESEKEMLASNLETLQTIISSLPENILQKLNLENTKSKA